jgi:signal peptide peptidase SppA
MTFNLLTAPTEEAVRAMQSIRLGDLFAGSVAAIHEPALGRSLFSFGQSQGAKSVKIPAEVAVVRVHGALMQRGWASWWGTLSGYDTITDAFAAACADPNVEAILLHVDSPGGMVAGCFEAVRRMQEARDKAGKPVVAFADELAASAAYAISCVADAGIYGPATAEIGSVGAVIVHMSEARALDALGIDVSVFRSGDRKAEGNWFEKLTDDAKAALQANVDETGKDFAKLVGASRGKNASEVQGWRAAIFGAREAVNLGVADRVASLEEAAAAALKEARRRRKDKDMKTKLALGLNENATEEEAVAAATAAKAAEGNLDKLLGAIGAKTIDEALGALTGLQETATEHAKLVAEHATLSKSKLEKDVDDLVRRGREAGKITASSEADWREDATANLAKTEARLTRAPVIVSRERAQEAGGEKTKGKLWEDLSVEEMAELQEKEPEKFQALLDEYRARTGRR